MQTKRPKNYNPTLLFQLVNGDKTQLRKMEDIFLTQVDDTIIKMNECVETEDWQRLASLAHRMKTSIDIMQIEVLKQPIRRIEALGGKAKDAKELIELVAFTKKTLEEVAAEIKTIHST